MIRLLATDLHEPVIGIVGADLLRLREVVQVFFYGKEVGKRPPTSRATRVRRYLDLCLNGLAVDVGRFELGFVEEPSLLRRDLLALRSEALGAEQAVPLFEERETFGLLIEESLLLEDDLSKRID